MTRAAVFGLLLFFCLTPSASLAQLELGAPEEQEALPAFALPRGSAREVGGEATVDLADFVAEYLAETGTVPDFAQVEAADGDLRTLSAAEVFTLLARTTHLWRFTGNLPESIPLSPDQVSHPVLDPDDTVEPPADPEAGRGIPTEQFLAVCPAVVRWIDRLQVIPTSVWVDGQRLSAAEYLAGLAICVSYAYWEGRLYESIVLLAYAAPQSWAAGEALAYAEAQWQEEPLQAYEREWESEEPYWEWEAAGSTIEETFTANVPLYAEAEPETPPSETTLLVFPEPGSTVSGIVDVVVSYSGPPERFVVFDVDARSEVIMNFPPYSCRWDTRELEPGVHTVRVRVLGDEDTVLADQMSAFIVVPPESEPPELDLSDEL